MEILCMGYITLLKSQAFELKCNFGNVLSSLCQLGDAKVENEGNQSFSCVLKLNSAITIWLPPFLSSLCFNFSFPQQYITMRLKWFFIEHLYLSWTLMTAPQNEQSNCKGSLKKVYNALVVNWPLKKRLSLIQPYVQGRPRRGART